MHLAQRHRASDAGAEYRHVRGRRRPRPERHHRFRRFAGQIDDFACARPSSGRWGQSDHDCRIGTDHRCPPAVARVLRARFVARDEPHDDRRFHRWRRRRGQGAKSRHRKNRFLRAGRQRGCKRWRHVRQRQHHAIEFDGGQQPRDRKRRCRMVFGKSDGEQRTCRPTSPTSRPAASISAAGACWRVRASSAENGSWFDRHGLLFKRARCRNHQLQRAGYRAARNLSDLRRTGAQHRSLARARSPTTEVSRRRCCRKRGARSSTPATTHRRSIRPTNCSSSISAVSATRINQRRRRYRAAEFKDAIFTDGFRVTAARSPACRFDFLVRSRHRPAARSVRRADSPPHRICPSLTSGRYAPLP